MKELILSKKFILIAIGLLLCSFIIFVSLEMYSVKKGLEQEHHIMLTNRNGENLFSERNIESPKEVPDMISSYILKEGKLSTLASELYPANYLKQSLARILASTVYSKNELLKIYINNTYYEHGLVGMATASDYYFNKKLNQTTKDEQLFLLCMTVQKKTGNLQSDCQSFLNSLLEKGYLSKVEYKENTVKMDLLINSLKTPDTYAQSYIDQALLETEKSMGISKSELIRSGFIIHTNLDKKVQQSLYRQFQTNENFPLKENPQLESGMVILDNRTGKVLGLMGGREYQKTSLNRASQTTRQPASTFKPLIVFAPAIESGWKPSSTLKDVPMRVGGYVPHNFDYQYRQKVSFQDTVINSYNVPTVWLLYKIGLNTGLDYINKFNLFTINPEDGYKLALGFPRVGTSPLALAQAYTIFPNKGQMVTAHTINSVQNQKGKQIFKSKMEQKRIIKEHTAHVMNTLLRKVVTDGTGNKANMDGEFVAGKTGTTSYDAWFVGYTKKYVAVVWMGPDTVNPNHKLILKQDEGSPTTLFKKVLQDIK